MFRAQLLPALTLALTALVNAQSNDDLGVANGFLDFKAGQFTGQLVNDSQTLASLKPGTDFDFLPSDLLADLTSNGAHHIGDVSFRFKLDGAGNWTTVDSASARNPVQALADLAPGVIAAADLAATLPSGVPLTVTREWLPAGDGLALRVNFTNTANGTVELGALGLPVAINNIFSRPSAEETQAKCSLADPLHRSRCGLRPRLPRKGPRQCPRRRAASLEPIRGIYEGTYEWMIHSQAWAETEWKGATPWNTPTSKTLKAGETFSVGLKFVAAESIQTIEDAVTKAEIPLAVGIPGYVVPTDLTARLYLTHSSPVRTIDGDAFTIKQDTAAKGSPYLLTPTAGAWGRAKPVTLGLAWTEAKNWIDEYSDNSNGNYRGPGQTLISVDGALFHNITVPFPRLRGGFRYLTLYLMTNTTTPSPTLTINDMTLEIRLPTNLVKPPRLPRLLLPFLQPNSQQNLVLGRLHPPSRRRAPPPRETGRVLTEDITNGSWSNEAWLGVGSSLLLDGAKTRPLDLARRHGRRRPLRFSGVWDLPSRGPARIWMLRAAMDYIYGKVIPETGILNAMAAGDWARYVNSLNGSAPNMLLYRTLTTGAFLADLAPASNTSNLTTREAPGAGTNLTQTWLARAESLKTSILTHLWGPLKESLHRRPQKPHPLPPRRKRLRPSLRPHPPPSPQP
ncbi:hypothetical protein CSAL01_06115 [Colletotrichum salicis]|uniref:Uncharacterized protein n=1 Tax=Colletotrichum salicis TaxID=1209931 RepID=A0A135VA81_9PEZI|nr:hypothetical protein CSAL01_06115 [Colletotrichum salicis]